MSDSDIKGSCSNEGSWTGRESGSSWIGLWISRGIGGNFMSIEDSEIESEGLNESEDRLNFFSNSLMKVFIRS